MSRIDRYTVVVSVSKLAGGEINYLYPEFRKTVAHMSRDSQALSPLAVILENY